MDELRAKVADSQYDIIGITESWCSSDITDAELSLSGYQMFRSDRMTRGGGVLLYVSEAIEVICMEDLPTFGFNDCIWCKLWFRDMKLVVGVCYRSPVSSSSNDEALLSLFRSVGDLAQSDTCIVIMGDFNLPEVDFNSSSVQGSCSFAGRVCDCVLDNFWKQHVTHCTRFRDGQTPSCLDWILTDNPDIVDELTYEEPIGKSDHVCLSWDMSFDKQQIFCRSKV